MKIINLIVTDEVSKSVAVIETDKFITSDIDESLYSLRENEQFKSLFLQVVKEDVCDDEATLIIDSVEYFSIECFLKISVKFIYEIKEDFSILDYYLQPIEIYKLN